MSFDMNPRDDEPIDRAAYAKYEADQHDAEVRNRALEEAYQAARGGESRFEKHGTRQLYWKGRSDAATAIRALKQSHGEET
jgi:hypothetical protein